MQDPQEFRSDFSQSLLMKMQNSGEPKGSPRIMIRYIMNKNALKDFTPFCDENCKNRTQAMVNDLIGILEDPTFQMTLELYLIYQI